MKILTNLDLSQNEIQNAIMQPLAAPPANPKLGQIYFSSVDLTLYLWTGEKWIPVPTKLSQLENDSKFITAKDVPEGATASTPTPRRTSRATGTRQTAIVTPSSRTSPRSRRPSPRPSRPSATRRVRASPSPATSSA